MRVIKQAIGIDNWSNFPFAPSNWRIFYGWFIVFIGTLGTLMSVPGQTIGISTFTDYLIDALDLTRNQLSTAYMLGTITSSLFLTYAGKLYDRYGARIVGALAATGMGAVLLYLTQSDNIAVWLSQQITFIPPFILAFVVVYLGFFLLRFFGQGVLTMVSRNMIMKWFDKRRGLANAFYGPFISLGFSGAPLLFDYLIQNFGWKGAWTILGISFGFMFTVLILIFYRDNPEKSGLKADGPFADKAGKKTSAESTVYKDYTLKEARKSFSFWVFIIAVSMFALYITGFTFHVVSIFKDAGMDRTMALAIFLPVSVVAVSLNVLGSWLSDFIKLKYLLMVMVAGGIISCYGLINLSEGYTYWMIVAGNGMLTGMFGILSNVTWPKFYGRKNLGAISGFNISMNVFFSAVGPMIFSQSFSITGSYATAGIIALIVWGALLLGSIKAENPQKQFTPES